MRRAVNVFSVGPEYLLTVRQAAELVGVSRNEIRNAIRSGEMSVIFVGSEPRIPRWLITKWQEWKVNKTENIVRSIVRRKAQ